VVYFITGFSEGYNANHALYLAVNWTTLFVVKHVILLFQDMIIPWYNQRRKALAKKSGIDSTALTKPEADFTRHTYIESENRYKMILLI